MKKVLVLMATTFMLFSCGGEAQPEAESEGVSTEVSETLKSEQELNDQVHELHDDLDEMLESL